MKNYHSNVDAYGKKSHIYVITHTRRITIHVQESPYRYETPYFNGDFFDNIRI